MASGTNVTDRPPSSKSLGLPDGVTTTRRAAGRLPESARGADATPSGVALSAAASAVAENYQRCHENAEQLTFLQLWVSKTLEASRVPVE